jgi:hypothetical protein
MLEHARLLSEWQGEASAIRAFRQHTCWYTKGFLHGASLRATLMHVSTLQELKQALASVDRDQSFAEHGWRTRRGKSTGEQQVSLPEGYLDNLDDAPPSSD